MAHPCSLPQSCRWACAGEVPASEKELRAQLRELQAERDALLKDVEALCMQACMTHSLQWSAVCGTLC